MTLILMNTKTNKIWLKDTRGLGNRYWRAFGKQCLKGSRRWYIWANVKHDFIGIL